MKSIKATLILIITLNGCSIFGHISDDSENERIVFCKQLLDSPENLKDILQNSQYYDSSNYKFLFYFEESKNINEFLLTYKDVVKYCLNSNYTEYSIWPILRDKKVHIISYLYDGVEIGIDLHFTKNGNKYKLSKLSFNRIETEFQVSMFYNKISQVFKEIQSNPDSLNELIERNDLYCKYKLGSDTNYSTRFHSDQFIDLFRINFFKKNRENPFSIVEISNGWEYTKPQLWTEILLTFENSNDKLNMQVTYYDCLPCIWQMEFNEP